MTRQSITRSDMLERARAAMRQRRWGDAFANLSAADREASLDSPDLEHLAMTAYLVGRDDDSGDAWARAHRIHLDAGDAERAARCAFWMGFGLLDRGETAQGAGWLARARRLLDDGNRDCVEQGYLLVPVGIRCVREGDDAAAYAAFVKASTIGRRFGDPDLVAMALNGEGRALIRGGDIEHGVTLLDEAMVAVTAGEVSPAVVGGVYCSVIEGCHEIFDLRRAHEWTTALGEWCGAQPDLVPYRGRCLVHRAEILRFHGAWTDALDEGVRARDRLSQPTPKPAVGAAFYLLAELHRLRGEFEAAEASYREASRWRRPDPGLALLRLVQGDIAAAAAAINRAASEVQSASSRVPILAAQVEIAIAAQDVSIARRAGAELAAISGRFDAPLLDAVSSQAEGAVSLAAGDAGSAVVALRRSSTAWRELGAPYETARARVLLALACRELGDADTAAFELDAARAAFDTLGARPDLARIRPLLHPNGSPSGPLTSREVQVLRLVASGRTNRAIAVDLGISEKTVARHLSNIFVKLDLSSRAAATAFAFRHELL